MTLLKKMTIFSVILINICCTKQYSIKSIQETPYLHLFQNYYFRLQNNDTNIQKFYKNNNNKIIWSNFIFDQNNLAKIKIYLSSEKLNKKKLKNLNNNFSKEIFQYINTTYNNGTIKKMDHFNQKDHIAIISHYPAHKRIQPQFNNWQKGFVWNIEGAQSEISIYFIKNNRMINYQLVLIYQPSLNSQQDAENKYFENENEIIEIINRLKT